MWLIQNVQNVNFTVTKIEDGLTIHTKKRSSEKQAYKIAVYFSISMGLIYQ